VVEFFCYPAGHAFHNEKDQLAAYHKKPANLAWERAVAFLKANVD
jgi:dienelactone hydrolase